MIPNVTTIEASILNHRYAERKPLRMSKVLCIFNLKSIHQRSQLVIPQVSILKFDVPGLTVEQYNSIVMHGVGIAYLYFWLDQSLLPLICQHHCDLHGLICHPVAVICDHPSRHTENPLHIC